MRSCWNWPNQKSLLKAGLPGSLWSMAIATLFWITHLIMSLTILLLLTSLSQPSLKWITLMTTTPALTGMHVVLLACQESEWSITLQRKPTTRNQWKTTKIIPAEKHTLNVALSKSDQRSHLVKCCLEVNSVLKRQIHLKVRRKASEILEKNNINLNGGLRIDERSG